MTSVEQLEQWIGSEGIGQGPGPSGALTSLPVGPNDILSTGNALDFLGINQRLPNGREHAPAHEVNVLRILPRKDVHCYSF